MANLNIINWKKGFLKKQISGRTGSIHPEISTIHSEHGVYKSLVTSGATVMLTLASQKIFHLRTAIVDNQGATSQIIRFADGAAVSSNPKLDMTVGPYENYALTGLEGIMFTTYVTIDPQKAMGASGDCKVMIGGIYRGADATI
jgi:hypothetical protein